ncbi:hypothetical protein U7230_14640 [Carboxydochorda subterranea]|uniref:Uncharacterized protein n=1 Tax=Carboxydichorda subterranea TaxID=3109565 RepID=A0ABZ1BXI4_9FIRM|nr:hypothetical protein [Limnochorda sp. L945t]WRP17298.1 hypothetical protein U7230_14640 [Limnochorda sp. L945t]
MAVAEALHVLEDGRLQELTGRPAAAIEPLRLQRGMETSALYMLGRFRGVEVCHLLLISHELWHGRPAVGSAELRAAEE